MPNDRQNNTEKPEQSTETNKDRMAMRWVGYGIEFVGVLGIFTYMGYAADERWGTGPWLMVTGLMISFIGMIYLLVKESAKWQK